MAASEREMGVTEVIRNIADFPELSRAASKLRDFSDMILEYRERIQDPECGLTELLDSLITRISYLEYLKEDEPEKLDDRKENIDELRNRIEAYEEDTGTIFGRIDRGAVFGGGDRCF